MSTNDQSLDDLSMSSEYADYIMEHCGGDRIICNGDTLTEAMEDGYLWKDFLWSIGRNEDEDS